MQIFKLHMFIYKTYFYYKIKQLCILLYLHGRPSKAPSLTISNKIKYYIYIKLNFNGRTQLASLYFSDNINKKLSSRSPKKNQKKTTTKKTKKKQTEIKN